LALFEVCDKTPEYPPNVIFQWNEIGCIGDTQP